MHIEHTYINSHTHTMVIFIYIYGYLKIWQFLSIVVVTINGNVTGRIKLYVMKIPNNKNNLWFLVTCLKCYIRCLVTFLIWCYRKCKYNTLIFIMSSVILLCISIIKKELYFTHRKSKGNRSPLTIIDTKGAKNWI